MKRHHFFKIRRDGKTTVLDGTPKVGMRGYVMHSWVGGLSYPVIVTSTRRGVVYAAASGWAGGAPRTILYPWAFGSR